MVNDFLDGLGDIMSAEFKIGKAVMQFVKDDITTIKVDAVVNAANSSLMGGGGVDGAIHAKGGPKILEECRKIRVSKYPDGLPTGMAVITSGGNLPSRYVIHTVGPVWHGGIHDEPELLRQAYLNSLRLAVSWGLKSVAFPSISTGAYGYPIESACKIAVLAVKEFLENEDNLEKVLFVLFSERDFQVYFNSARSLIKEN